MNADVFAGFDHQFIIWVLQDAHISYGRCGLVSLANGHEIRLTSLEGGDFVALDDIQPFL